MQCAAKAAPCPRPLRQLLSSSRLRNAVMLHLQAYLVGDPFAVGAGHTDRSGKLTASRILDAVPPPPASIGGGKQAAAACALTAEMRWSPSAVARPSKMPYDTGKGHSPVGP